MLIMDLAGQYRGNNNGDLCPAWSLMKDRGWKSKDTLSRAKKELIDKHWIIVTREGGISRKGDRKIACLCALTFWGMDECNGKLDPHIRVIDKPMDTWKRGNTPPDIIKEKQKMRARKINSAGTTTVPKNDLFLCLLVRPPYTFLESSHRHTLFLGLGI